MAPTKESKYIEPRSVRYRHHLAVWPGEGLRHAPQCAFHRLDAEMGGRAAYEVGELEAVGVVVEFASAKLGDCAGCAGGADAGDHDQPSAGS